MRNIESKERIELYSTQPSHRNQKSCRSAVSRTRRKSNKDENQRAGRSRSVSRARSRSKQDRARSKSRVIDKRGKSRSKSRGTRFDSEEGESKKHTRGRSQSSAKNKITNSASREYIGKIEEKKQDSKSSNEQNIRSTATPYQTSNFISDVLLTVGERVHNVVEATINGESLNFDFINLENTSCAAWPMVINNFAQSENSGNTKTSSPPTYDDEDIYNQQDAHEFNCDKPSEEIEGRNERVEDLRFINKNKSFREHALDTELSDLNIEQEYREMVSFEDDVLEEFMNIQEKREKSSMKGVKSRKKKSYDVQENYYSSDDSEDEIMADIPHIEIPSPRKRSSPRKNHVSKNLETSSHRRMHVSLSATAASTDDYSYRRELKQDKYPSSNSSGSSSSMVEKETSHRKSKSLPGPSLRKVEKKRPGRFGRILSKS